MACASRNNYFLLESNAGTRYATVLPVPVPASQPDSRLQIWQTISCLPYLPALDGVDNHQIKLAKDPASEKTIFDSFHKLPERSTINTEENDV